MNDRSDAQLLRDYAEHGSEAAFREIVARHTDFVYSAALRQLESADLAADIAQKVFVDLARKAGSVSRRLAAAASLAGWLHRGTRYAALNHLRANRRRLANERQAMNQLLANAESSVDWEQIRPALDEALDSLNDEDREALLLRYFKNQDYRAVGLALGIGDDAAQKRVSRAVDRLREFFSKRDVTMGASGLAVLISASAVQAAPVGLATTISASAILAGTTVSTSAAIATTKAIAMTTLQKTLVTATVTVLAGAGVYEARQAATVRSQVQTLQQQQAPLTGQIQELQRERDDATNRLAGLLAENERLKSNSDENELLRLRAEVTRLKQAADESENLKMKIQQLEGYWNNTSNSLPQFLMHYAPRGKWHVTGNGSPDEIFFSAATAATEGDEAKLSKLISNTNALSLFSKKSWDNVLGIQLVSTAFINNEGKETAIENTIIMKNVGNGQQIDPNQPPALTEVLQSFPEMHRWYFSKTEGGWKITGGD